MTKKLTKVLSLVLAVFMVFQFSGLGSIRTQADDDRRSTVYVYIKIVDQAGNEISAEQRTALGLQLNHSGWYTVGKISNVQNLDSNKPNTDIATQELGRTERFMQDGTVVNQYIDISEVSRWELKWCNQGADNYLAGGNCWHLDGILTTDTLRQYQVNYLDRDTNTALAAAKVGSGTLSASVTESPIAIAGYTPASNASATITLGETAENVINFYYTINKYVVSYDLNDGTTSSETTKFRDVPYGTATPSINNPVKGTDRFMGWTPSVAGTVTGDATYTAQWAETYTITYWDNNQQLTNMDSNRYITGESAAVLSCAAEHDHKNGRHIVGWSTDHNGTLIYNQKSKLDAFMSSSSFVAVGTPITFANNDIRLYAVWASDKIAETYTVTYDLAGGTSTTDQLVYSNLEYGATTPAVAQPTKAGYTFNGWDKTIAATVTENVTYTAQWTPNTVNYTVEYYYQTDGQYGTANSSVTTNTAKTGDSVSVTDNDKQPAADKTGYVLDDSQRTAWMGKIPAEGTLTLKVYFKQQFTVEYVGGEHGTVGEGAKTEKLDYNSDTPSAPETIGNSGYTFAGWNTIGGTTADKVTADATYTAQWTANTNTPYMVEYYYQKADGTYPSKEELAEAEKVQKTGTTDETAVLADSDKVPAADKTAYVLDEDNTNNVWSGNINGDGGLILKVYFKLQYTVEYVGGEHGTVGENAKTEELDHGTVTPAAPEVIPADGYTFTGWDKEIAETVTENVLYTAQYSINSYTVTYKVDGDVIGEVETYEYNKEVVLRDKYQKVGYTVSDWSVSDKTFTMPARDMEITATTSINSYTVTYMLDGEQYGEVEEHEFGEMVPYRAAVEKEGYTFSGWTMGRTLSFEMPAENVVITGSLVKDEEPEDPEESDVPEDSEGSEDPEESEESEDPTLPEDSDEPQDPEQPQQNEESQVTPPVVQPQQPEQEVQGAVVDKPVDTPAAPGVPTTATRPNTGDSTQPILWIVLMVIALAGCAMMVVYNKKKD